MRRLGVGAALLVAALALTACTEEEIPANGENFSERVAEQRAEAVKRGASAAQLAILDEIASTGEVTMEQLLAARAPYEECLSALGYTFIDRGVTNAFGYPYPDYAIDVTKDGGNDALIDECSARHFNFVDMLYQTQPIAQQTQEENFVKAMPTLIACLEKGGVSVPENPTPDELKAILHDVSGAQTANPDGTVDSLVMSCMNEVGIQAY